MNSIVEDIIDLLQDKSNLSSPYRSVFVISSSCFFKMLSSIILILIKRDCLADWKRGSEGGNGTYWVNAVLKIVSKFMIMQMTQT